MNDNSDRRCPDCNAPIEPTVGFCRACDDLLHDTRAAKAKDALDALIGPVLMRIDAPKTECPACHRVEVNGWGVCVPCAQEKDELAANQLHRAQLSEALGSIPERYRWARFGIPELAARVENRHAIARVESLDIGKQVVTLTGPSGAGKTVLAAARFRAHVDVPPTVRKSYFSRFVRAVDVAEGELARQLGRGRSDAGRLAREAPFAVVDDVGMEPNTEPCRAAIRTLLADRFDDMKPTIITTGLTTEVIIERYGDHVARRMLEAVTINVQTFTGARLGVVR